MLNRSSLYRTVLGSLVIAWVIGAVWVSHVGAQDLLNGDLTYNGYMGVRGPNPGTPDCPGGVVTLTLDFLYNGTPDYDNLFIRIVTLDAPRMLVSGGGAGTDVAVPGANLGPDQMVSQGEMFSADLEICLPDLNSFPLLVDVFGSEVVVKRVFVTSSRHSGNLGGLAGADAICNQRAQDVSLGGTWRAWLSSSTVNARDRITDAAYTLVNGTPVASSLNDLTDGNIDSAISRDENDVQYVGAVWTGTFETGLRGGFICNDWTSEGGRDRGDYGFSLSSSSGWTFSNSLRCEDQAPLYCFEE